MNKFYALNYVAILLIVMINGWGAMQGGGGWLTAVATGFVTGTAWFLGMSFGRLKESEEDLERERRSFR